MKNKTIDERLHLIGEFYRTVFANNISIPTVKTNDSKIFKSYMNEYSVLYIDTVFNMMDIEEFIEDTVAQEIILEFSIISGTDHKESFCVNKTHIFYNDSLFPCIQIKNKDIIQTLDLIEFTISLQIPIIKENLIKLKEDSIKLHNKLLKEKDVLISTFESYE